MKSVPGITTLCGMLLVAHMHAAIARCTGPCIYKENVIK